MHTRGPGETVRSLFSPATTVLILPFNRPSFLLLKQCFKLVYDQCRLLARLVFFLKALGSNRSRNCSGKYSILKLNLKPKPQ